MLWNGEKIFSSIFVVGFRNASKIAGDKSLFFAHTMIIKRRRWIMNKFTTGMLIGGVMTAAGMGYMMMDRRMSHQMAKKGKRMVVKAEEAIDDMMDGMMP